MDKGQLRSNSLLYLGLAIAMLVVYRLMFAFSWFSDMQRVVAGFVLTCGALLLGWMAFMLFRKGVPTGSNLGCMYLVLLLATLIASAVGIFLTLTFYFSLD